MECTDGQCTLVGNVELRCATTRLNADHVDIFYDDKQQFAGAHRQGARALHPRPARHDL